MFNYMSNFLILKVFGICSWPGKFSKPIKVLWNFPTTNWTKVNTNEAARGRPRLASCAGIFRGIMGNFVGSFSSFLRVQKSFFFFGWIHGRAIKKVRDIGLQDCALNTTLPRYVLLLLQGNLSFGLFIIDGINVCLFVKPHSSKFHTFLEKTTIVLINLLL